MRKSLFIAVLLATPMLGQTLANPTPPMGSNNFYWQFQASSTCAPTETVEKAQADAQVSTGLAALGYTLVSMDDCWAQRTGGLLVGIPAQFPSGIASLVSYVHSKGLTFGIYSSPDTTTCGGYPGSLGNETTDASTFFGWGVDYLKYDACPTGTQAQYQSMGTALSTAYGHNIPFLVNASSGSIPSYQWFQTVGGSSNRSWNDIGSVTMDSRLFGTTWSTYAPYQNKGHWLDPDYIMCDLKVNNGAETVTDTECRTQFTQYAILAAPLVIAANLTTLSANTLATLSNTEVIAIDQDSRGTMGSRISQVACGATFCEVWLRQLADCGRGVTTCYALEMVNRDTTGVHDVSTTWAALGITGSWNVRDLWAHSYKGSSSTGYTATAVGAYQAMIYKLTPVGTTTSFTGTMKGAHIQ